MSDQPPTTRQPPVGYVERHVIVKSASKLSALVLLGSFLLWAASGVELVNPCASILGLIACPFFYWIGVLMGRRHEPPLTTDILARIQRELAHPIMRHSGSGEVEEETLLDAAAEIGRLREALLAVQRSAFDAGYDAARDGRPRLNAYAEWSNQ